MIMNSPPETPRDDILLRVYMEHVRKSLRAKLLPVAEAAIEEAVVEAIEPLRAQIVAYKSDLGNALIVNLSVDGVKK